MKTEDNQQDEQIEVVKPLEKRTRKNKGDISKVSKSSHNTRRRQQPDSSQQYLLPAQIPKSKGTESVITEGSQNQLQKVVIRIPHSLLIIERFISENIVHVQNQKIMIIISKQLDSVSVHAKYLLEERLTKVENNKNFQEDQDFIDVDKINEPNHEQLYDYILPLNIWGKYVYLSGFESQNKVIKKVRKDLSTFEGNQIIKFKIKQPNSDLFVYLNFRLEERLSDDFNGLINQGNTCYMNSYLQTLYHIPAFRNLVYEAEIQEESKFPATLQELFFHLGRAQKSVSPQLLVKSFGWGKREANVQQDAQQFSCLFFEALERKLNESAPLKGYRNRTIEGLFKGQLNHYIRCAQVGTVIDNPDFRRQNFEEFMDLQLPIYPTLKQSLDAYTSEVHMEGDNKYWTEQHGFQEAFKGVKIAYFPPVLMIQLKRFQYSFDQGHNIKILTALQYEEQFDFSPWSTTGENQVYELYAVLVHEGARAQSGHYYNFAKENDIWYKFNDEIVQQVCKQKVFQYNFGGFHESLQFDAKEMKVQKKLVESKTTAYMLVYIKKQFKQSLMTDQNNLPQWIKKKNQFKLQQQQIRKKRKNYFHNVSIIDWQTQLQGKNCAQMGFIDDLILQNSKKKIQKVPKQANIFDWLNSEKIVQSSNQQRKKRKKPSKILPKSDDQRNNDFGLFIYYASPERQNLIGFNVKHNHKMEDLLKLSTDPNPIIIKTPFQVKKDEYLSVIKRFKVQKDKQSIQVKYTYQNLLAIKKDIKYSDLLNLLKNQFQKKSQTNFYKNQQNGSLQKSYNFYIEEIKSGPHRIPNSQLLVPYPIPGKNQLLICVIQDLPSDLTAEEKENFSYLKWYQNKKDKIILTVSEQNGSLNFQIQDAHVNLSLQQLRKIIFEHVSKIKKIDFQSSQNIVLKAKIKKGSKVYTEVSQPEFSNLKELIKFQCKIYFHFSSLSVDSRASQHVLQFYYRWRNIELSQPIKVILNKNQQSQTIVKMIKNNQKILQMLKVDGFTEQGAQLVIFSKDWLAVNQVVTNEGKIIGRGDFSNYLKNVKNPILIVEGRTTFQLQSQPKIQMKEQDSDLYVYVLLHHVSQSIQRVGTPRFFKVDRRMELYELKNKIMDLIKDQVFGWQGKIHICNPFKTRIYLYGKDNKKVIDLTDLESLEQIKRLKIQEKNNNIQSKRKTSKDLKNSSRKQSNVEEIKESQIQMVNQVTKEEKNLQNTIKKDYIMSEQPQQNLTEDHIKNIQNDNKDEKKEEQPQNEEERLDQGEVTKIQGPQTIYGIFPKLKVLKVQIIHNYLIKPNITLRLNVDF